MSALISGVYLDRILVATDTYSAGASGRAQKLFPLPQLPAVLAGRGSAPAALAHPAGSGALGVPFDGSYARSLIAHAHSITLSVRRATGCSPIDPSAVGTAGATKRSDDKYDGANGREADGLMRQVVGVERSAGHCGSRGCRGAGGECVRWNLI